jgi:hypothetical protein
MVRQAFAATGFSTAYLPDSDVPEEFGRQLLENIHGP